MTAVACDAYTHVLADNTNLVVLRVVVDRSDGVRRSVATPGWSHETIDEWLSVVADCTDNVRACTDCLSEN